MARIEKEYEIKTAPERIWGLLTLDLIAILLVSIVAPLFVLISTAPTSSSLSHLFSLSDDAKIASDPPPTNAFGDLTAPTFENLALCVLYENGTYIENLTWEDIVWSEVSRVGIKSQFGIGGFRRLYGDIVWYPASPIENKIYDRPLWFVYERFWAKVGETWYKEYITQNVSKTPFLDNSDNWLWQMGWNGTITYEIHDFPVTVGMEADKGSTTWRLKTSVTTPIDLENHAIEYQLYLNPYWKDKAEKNIRWVRVYFENGNIEDYGIENLMDVTVKIPDMLNYFSFLTENKNIEVNTFDFSDIFGNKNAINKFVKIEQVTLPNGIETYILKIGVTYGALNAGETFVVDPNFGYDAESGAGWATTNTIRGSWFTCPEAGTADSISVYTRPYTGPENLKCAIYKKSDNSLVGSTEEIAISGLTQWWTLNFQSPKPSLTENTDYYLVSWCSGSNYLYCATETGKGAYDPEIYNSWPDPWSPSSDDRKYNIYCTYTPSNAFGYWTASTAKSFTTDNKIVGSKFTCPEAGTADSITLYMNTGGVPCHWKAAIYDNSLNFVGSTEEVTFDTEENFVWKTFNFAAPKPSLSNADYWLVVSSDAGGFPRLFGHPGAIDQGAYQNIAYENLWPDPLAPDNYQDREYCIYCTYTPSVLPTKPTLYVPENGSTTSDNTPHFEWTKGENADNHRLLVDNNPDFSSPNENRILTTDNYYTIADENSLPDDNYSWKVIAINEDGENSSDVWTFVLDTVAPSAPTLISPENNHTTADNTPRFVWTEPETPENYTLVIDNDADFGSPVQTDITDNTYTLTIALSDGVYYWRVREIDQAGNPGAWADSFKLTVDTSAPGAPVSLAASPSGWTSTNSFTVSWTNPSDLSGVAGAYYKLDSTPTSPTDGTYVAGVGLTSIFDISVPGDGSHPVYVWLKDRAGNVNHTNPNSTTLHLDTTAPRITLSPTLATEMTVTGSRIEISGTVSDLMSVTVKVNGVVVSAVGGSFSHTVNLSVGLNTITITAVDAVGNASSTSLSVIRTAAGAPAPPSASPTGQVAVIVMVGAALGIAFFVIVLIKRR